MAHIDAGMVKSTRPDSQFDVTFAKEARQSSRLDAWRMVLEKIDRIVSERPVTVEFAEPSYGMADVAGWSDGTKIFFNRPKALDMFRTQDALGAALKIKGLNYHELCHVLFTPRTNEDLTKQVIERTRTEGSDWFYAFNALEDQRIESLFTAMYGPSRRYFEAMILEWVAKEGSTEVAILLHGRTYLPSRIRVKAEALFVAAYNQDLLDRFKAVIDSYGGMVYPRDTIRGLQLIREYYTLMQELKAQQQFPHLPEMPVGDNGMHDHGSSGESRVKTGSASVRTTQKAKTEADKQRAKRAELDEQAREDIEAEQQDGDDGEGDFDGEPTDGEGDGESQWAHDAGEFPGKSKGGQPGDGQGGDPADGEGDGGKEAGTGAVEHHVQSDEEQRVKDALRDMVEEANDGLDDIADDPTLRADAKRMVDRVREAEVTARAEAMGEVFNRRTTSLTPDADDYVVIRRITDTLIRIRQEVEPTHMFRQPAGRLDIGRVIGRKSMDDQQVFRSFEEGSEEATSIEAVLLMDVSGSMSSRANDASRAVWVLKRAFDKVGIKCTTIVYDTDHHILSQPWEKAPSRIPVVNTGGGTQPQSALEQAVRVLSKSPASNRLLINVTDGGWGGADEAIYAPLMKALHKRGVITVLLGLDGATKAYGSHGSMIVQDIETIRQLPKVVGRFVAEIMRTAALNFA